MIPKVNLKKKRVSKKNKSSWRKHVDIKDVDEFLEDQRLDERLGEPLSTLKDEELFKVDTDKNEKQLTPKEKKRLRLAAPPKCFAMLQPHTKVPDPITKRNRVRTRIERMCPILKRKETERKAKGILTARELQSVNDKRKSNEEKLKEKTEDKFIEDIWTVKDKLEDTQWIDKVTKRHTLRGTGKLKKVIPRLLSDKNAFIRNVEIPHPGTSYNPSLKDHNNLLIEIAGKEVKIIKKEEHLQRVTKNMFRTISREKHADAWLVEMSQGLPDKEQTNDEIDDENVDSYYSINPPVENKKKTVQQRRKQKEQLLLKEKLLQAKLEKKKTADLHKLKVIKTEIENNEKSLKKQKERREKMKMYKLKEPKQLGRLKYEEADIDFNMREDLVGNLRNLKSEGNILTDRFRSMQKRNILPVTTRHNQKKAKVKKFVKPGFKDDWKKTVANRNIYPSR